MGEGDKVTVLEQKNEITSNLSSDSQTGKKSTFKQNLNISSARNDWTTVFCFFAVVCFFLFVCWFPFCFCFTENLYYRYVWSISEVKDKLDDLQLRMTI